MFLAVLDNPLGHLHSLVFSFAPRAYLDCLLGPYFGLFSELLLLYTQFHTELVDFFVLCDPASCYSLCCSCFEFLLLLLLWTKFILVYGLLVRVVSL